MPGLIVLIIIGVVIYNTIIKPKPNNTYMNANQFKKSNNSNNNIPNSFNKEGINYISNTVNKFENIEQDIKKEVNKRIEKEKKELEKLYKKRYEEILNIKLEEMRNREKNEKILNDDNFENLMDKFLEKIRNENTLQYKEKLNKIRDEIKNKLGDISNEKIIFENFDSLYNFIQVQKIYDKENLIEEALKHLNNKQVTKNDIEKAEFILKFALIEGSEKAAYYLGDLYFENKYMKKDMQTAFLYYKQAADKGNVKAQNNLGIILATGEGMLQDIEAAKYYFTLAYKNGSKEAGDNLKILCEYVD